MEEGRAVRHPTSGQRRDKVRIGFQTRKGYLELSIDPISREDMFMSQDQKGEEGFHFHMVRVPPMKHGKKNLRKFLFICISCYLPKIGFS